jgi:hypothetical protein
VELGRQRGRARDVGAEEDGPVTSCQGGSRGGGGQAGDADIAWAGGQAGRSQGRGTDRSGQRPGGG